MRTTLPKRIGKRETGIINMDQQEGDGTHWIGYVKHGRHVLYFDSVGSLKPPPEIINYFKSRGSVDIRYNFTRYQKMDTYNCGHLVLRFLYRYASKLPPVSNKPPWNRESLP